jgi:hypothetical protein
VEIREIREPGLIGEFYRSAGFGRRLAMLLRVHSCR